MRALYYMIPYNIKKDEIHLAVNTVFEEIKLLNQACENNESLNPLSLMGNASFSTYVSTLMVHFLSEFCNTITKKSVPQRPPRFATS